MDDFSSFENYCIVCDRLIAAPSEPEPVAVDKPKKKAQGTIRIKNPDGTTTIRNANGVKTTRPVRRTSAGDAKPAPAAVSAEAANGTRPGSAPVEPRFVSPIYCSRKCAEQDAGASGPAAYENMARVFGLGITTTSDAVVLPGHIGSMSPPSPLLGSDTDTTSSGASAAAVTASPASVPKTFGFFRMNRDGPEDAWKELSRQRRSSLAQASRFMAPLEPMVAPMSRQRSGTSRPQSTASATSTDSLSSLWQSEQEVGINRTHSSGGGIRGMTPIAGDNTMPPNRRSSSDGPTSAPRPLPRSAMSTTSLAGLPSPHAFPSEVGSAPSHTAFLMHSYASAFPARDGSPMLKPVPGLQTPDLRSSSVSNTPAPGTLRPRTRTGSSTWDAFGKAEVRERTRRNTGSSTNLAGSISREPSSPELNMWRERSNSISQVTPKQSLEDGGWQIRYARPMSRQATGNRSRSASREPRTAPVPEDAGSNATSVARPIPARATASSSAVASSNSTARSRTPQSRLSGAYVPSGRRSSAMVPDLAAIAAIRIGSPCAPVVSPETASPRDSSRSIPRAGFDWNASNHRTYELPPGVVVNPNKGLFYFKA